MNCRRFCESHLRGGPEAYDAAAKGLVVVFDMVKVAYRSIPQEGIRSIKIGGEWHPIEE